MRLRNPIAKPKSSVLNIQFNNFFPSNHISYTLYVYFINALHNVNSQAAAGHMRYELGLIWSKMNAMAMHN